jgi:hypothetical protein
MREAPGRGETGTELAALRAGSAVEDQNSSRPRRVATARRLPADIDETKSRLSPPPSLDLSHAAETD